MTSLLKFRWFLPTAGEAPTRLNEERYVRLKEEVEILKGVWTTKGLFTYQGKYHQGQDMTVVPYPKQKTYSAFYLDESRKSEIGT